MDRLFQLVVAVKVVISEGISDGFEAMQIVLASSRLNLTEMSCSPSFRFLSHEEL
jgi:hypothetical protein